MCRTDCNPSLMKVPVKFNHGRSLSDNLGGVYSYIRVMPDGLLLKSTQVQKKSVGQNMNK